MCGGCVPRNRGVPWVARSNPMDVRLTIRTDLAKVEAEACGFPLRDRQTTLFAFIGVEIFTIICVGLRMCSRYRTNRWRCDDWLMIAIFVRLVFFCYLVRFVRILTDF